MKDNYDVIVIGAGPAGYVAAIRAAQLGLNTICIDAMVYHGKPSLGGTCLNVGCIPSKALIESSETFHHAQHGYQEHGIVTSGVEIDVAAMKDRKEQIVSKLTGGIEQLFKANNVEWVHGYGRLMAGKQVMIINPETNETVDTISAPNIILAAGSVPVEIPSLPFDHETILNSDDVLDFDTKPDKLVIVGAGVIGLELGSVWNRLGTEVTLLEAQTDFLSVADRQVASEALRAFKKQGLNIQLGAMVQGVETEGNGATVSYTQNGETRTIEADKVAVTVGRKPNTNGLLAADSGIQTDERGFVKVDENCQTDIKGVWAIGDLVRGPMLAHKGSEEGVAVAERIAGHYAEPLTDEKIPSVIYCHPEIAWVGKTEQQLKEEGTPYKVGRFPFAASGRALAAGDSTGFIKLIAHAETDRILAAHIIGAKASELIAEVVFAIDYQACAEDIARTIHAHPTLSEAMKEAALAIHKEAIHIVNK